MLPLPPSSFGLNGAPAPSLFSWRKSLPLVSLLDCRCSGLLAGPADELRAAAAVIPPAHQRQQGGGIQAIRTLGEIQAMANPGRAMSGWEGGGISLHRCKGSALGMVSGRVGAVSIDARDVCVIRSRGMVSGTYSGWSPRFAVPSCAACSGCSVP